MLNTYFTNRDLPQLYLDWLKKNQITECVDYSEAELLMPRTRGMRDALVNRAYPKAQVVVGFPYSYQVAAKDFFWLNMRRHFGVEIASQITPYSITTDHPNSRSQLIQLLQENHRIILKGNLQQRKSIKIVSSIDELEKTSLSFYVIGQKVVENGRLIMNRHFNIRLYFAVSVIDRTPGFFIYPVGKLIYAKTDGGLITSNDFYHKSLPLFTSDPQIENELGSDLFTRCQHVIRSCTQALKPNFLRTLRPGIAYFDLFGVDLLVTESKEVLALEFNRSPSMKWISTDDRLFKKDVLNSFLNAVKNQTALGGKWQVL